MSAARRSPAETVSQISAQAHLHYRRIVVKAGTSVLTSGSESHGLNTPVVADLVRQICWLREHGAEVLLVTSGAIAAGRQALHQAAPNSEREQPEKDIISRQVLAAVGQSRLMHTYQQLFDAMGFQVAQILLTINDLSDRQSYLNVGNTLTGLLELGVIPILNENDVVAVDEIGEVFGDNDRLSALHPEVHHEYGHPADQQRVGDIEHPWPDVSPEDLRFDLNEIPDHADARCLDQITLE